MELIKPKTVSVTDADGAPHEFVISRLPATAGREVLSKYPLANMPKTGDYETSKDAMLLLMGYVGKDIDGQVVRLRTQALIDNHVPDGEALIRLEIEMLKYNTSFFGAGSGQGFLDYLLTALEGSLPKIIKTLTRSLEKSLAQDSQRSQN